VRRAVLLALTAGLLLSAAPPMQDSRNTNTPGTDTHAALAQFHSLRDWERRKAQLRLQILTAAGLNPAPPRTPLHPQIFGRIENGDYSVEKVLIETLPGYYLGGNLYRPANRPGKYPGVLNPHGHWTYGRLENQPLYSGQTFGINLARQGYIVFAYDMVGYNDTIQTPHVFGNPAEQLWSFGPLSLQLWNSIRALDFLASLDDVDSARLGVAGASGGATQAFLLTAVDDRIQFAAPVNMVSAIMQGGDFCENAPGLRRGTSNVEVAAMFAPKPMLLVSATGDWTHNVPHEELPAIQRIYALYGKPENVEVVQIDAPHNFNKESREAVYGFFGRRVPGQTNPKSFSEKEVRIEKLQDMLALSGRGLPANAVTYAQLLEEWKGLAPVAATDNETRERLKLALGVEWPRSVESAEGPNGAIVLGRPGEGDRVPGVLLPGQGSPILVVDPRGSASARRDPAVMALRDSGRPILLIDAFQTGSAGAPRDRGHPHFLTFNLSDDACRVQDILTAMRFLHDRYKGSVELAGFGDARIWTEFAAAVAPIPVHWRPSATPFKGADRDFLDHFFVPGIQRAGGIAGADRLTATLTP
jgi:dienelactone hydrolase